jgi:hypothetical protein
MWRTSGYQRKDGTSETVRRHADEDSLSREWYRPWPPDPTFSWSMRDNVNYQQTAALAILDLSARRAKDMLREFYQVGYNSWRKGIDEKPYAFVIPAAQPDRLRVVQMVSRLRDQHIEAGQLQADVTLDEGRFEAGDYLVRLDQPYRNFAVDVLQAQQFPGDQEQLPYDDVSWAYPVGFDVRAVRIEDERFKRVDAALLTENASATGSVSGAGPVYLLRDQGQESLLAARFRLAAFTVEIANAAFTLGKIDYPPGSWIVSAAKDAHHGQLHGAIEAVSQEHALDLHSTATVPDVSRHQAVLPRIGLWVPWADTVSQLGAISQPRAAGCIR